MVGHFLAVHGFAHHNLGEGDDRVPQWRVALFETRCIHIDRDGPVSRVSSGGAAITRPTGGYWVEHEEKSVPAQSPRQTMPPRNNIEDTDRGVHSPATDAPRPGHRIREIRREIHRRHPGSDRYRVTDAHAAPHSPLSRASLMSVTSDLYQERLYTKSRSRRLRDRLSAVREAIQTSPYTWEELAADGVKEWVEESVEDDVLLASALESLGELTSEERAYLGKFTVERIYEILTNAEAAYWRRYFRH